MKKGTQIVKQETQSPAFNIEGLINNAVAKGATVETMKELLAMRKELKAEWAKEEYDKAMAAFQAESPTIEKTKSVKTKLGIVAYKYAPIDSIVSQVKGYLQKNGFSYSTNMELIENGTTKVKVSIKVTHKAGHVEITEMTVPLGNKTDIMSQSQVIAAAQTFAKRYAFCNAFGILTGDEDNEVALKTTLTDKQLADEYIKKIDNAKTLSDLAKVANSMKGKIKPEFQPSLQAEYSRRKAEIEEAEVDSINEDFEESQKGKDEEK